MNMLLWMYQIFDKWVIYQAQLPSSSRLQPLRREDLLVFYLNGNWIPLQFKDVSWAFWETSDEHFSLNSWHFIDQRIKLLIWKVMNKSNLKKWILHSAWPAWDTKPLCLYHSLFVSVSEHHIHTCTALSVHTFMATVLPLSFIVFDATNRHQRVPDDEAICPRLPCPGLHPLCPQYFVWVPGSNSQQHHIANTFLFFFFVSIIGRPDSTRGATGQRVQISWPQALGHFALYRPIGVCDLFWMLPWQLAYSAGVCSRWCFFANTI